MQHVAPDVDLAGLGEGVHRLHAGDDSEAGEAGQVGRVQRLDVLDPVPPGRRLARSQRLVGVERLADGRVADGVQLHLPAAGMCDGHRLAQVTVLPARIATRIGSRIRLEQVGRPRLHDAVQERFQDPGSQPRRVGLLRPQRLELVEPLHEADAAGRHVERQADAERKPAV